MPDATTETNTGASEKKPPPAVNPDRVGEELADDATIWPIYDKLAREDDERRTKTWDNGLNNLALFAGLFSAVTTAFIIEAQQDLEPDYAQLTFLVLNATAFGEKPVNQPFVVPSSARIVTCLWVASLILSLSAALIAIMGKDWIGMYTARPVCNLRQWAEMRSYRLHCVERWYMSGVIALAPVLLHLSLLLFGAGLVLFISSDPLTHHLTLGLSLAAGVLYLVTTFSAVVFSTSPFKSPATQMIRAALSSLFSNLRIVLYRPKRNLVATILRDINALVVGRAEDTTLLPGSAPEAQKSRIYMQPGRVVASAGRASIAYMRKIPTALRTAQCNLQWLRVRLRLQSIVSPVQGLQLDDWFLSSAWTDLPADRRPKLLADALSWLHGASQAPDLFRAIVFALGDLDIGPQVGMHTSIALRTRLRAEFRRTWQQVDLLTLARYVLAECNTCGNAKMTFEWLEHRFWASKELLSHCEDALAARVKAFPAYISPYALERYFPGTARVSQPRMAEFLMPYMLQTERYLLDVLVILAHRYRAHFRAGDSFNFQTLEAHLYRALDDDTRDAYATEVNVKYGGTAGAVELLTFLCCHASIDGITKTAAVELLMHIIENFSIIEEHRCLAYLFGSSELWQISWKDKHWSEYSLWRLSRCLADSCQHPFQPSSARTLSDDREFDLALARTSVMLLSAGHENLDTISESRAVLFLFGYICHPSSRRLPDNDDKLNISRLILTSGALLRIVGMPEYVGYFKNTVNCRTSILAEIIRGLSRHLRNGGTDREGEQLLQALIFTEVKGDNGESLTWDLGDWLRAQAPEILKKCPCSATAMQSVHDALVELYPLCEAKQELRAQWDRIGYPGRPGDIFSDPFLDVGAFFDAAEAPRAPAVDTFDDRWLDLTEFFDGAETGTYMWTEE